MFQLKVSMPAPRIAPLQGQTKLPEVLQFMQLVWAVVHGLDQTSKRMGHDLGVTGPQRLALRVVGLYPGVSAGEVARILHVHPSTLTGVLSRLTERGLVRRGGDAEDRRRALLWLTPKGERANRVKTGTVEAAMARALSGMSDRERTTVRRALERLASHLVVKDGDRE
jgi:DNA-binding MarR family transcriptional regulator